MEQRLRQQNSKWFNGLCKFTDCSDIELDIQCQRRTAPSGRRRRQAITSDITVTITADDVPWVVSQLPGLSLKALTPFETQSHDPIGFCRKPVEWINEIKECVFHRSLHFVSRSHWLDRRTESRGLGPLRPRSTFRLRRAVRSVTEGNQWSGLMKSFQDQFHWSAPLVSFGNWWDDRPESESGLGPLPLTICLAQFASKAPSLSFWRRMPQVPRHCPSFFSFQTTFKTHLVES